MNTRFSNHSILIFLCLVLFTITNCNKDKNKPAGFSADFNTSFSNGGMVPDSVTFSAAYPDAEKYDWNISGTRATGKKYAVKIISPGQYIASLTASSGSYSESETTYLTLKNYPPNGTSASFLNGNGEISTAVISGSDPFALPIDSIETIQVTGGMDYDDDEQKLYYTGSIIKANPNGTFKETILVTDPPGEFIRDLVVDSEDDMVYYSYSQIQQQTDEVYKMPTSGGQSEFLFEWQPSVDHLALNASEDIVFAVSDGDNYIVIYKPNMGLTPFISFDGAKHALVWNNTEGMLYFVEDVDQDDTYDIVKSDPTAVNPTSEIVFADASTEPIVGIDVDETNQILYWTDQIEGAIFQLDLKDPQATPKIVFLGISNPRSLAIGNFAE